MKNEATIRGVVLEALPQTNFIVEISDNVKLLCYLAGKMRQNFIKVNPGDRVEVVPSPDGKRGRIIKRL